MGRLTLLLLVLVLAAQTTLLLSVGREPEQARVDVDAFVLLR